MNEVDIQTVDLSREVRQRFQMRLAPAPVVIRAPVLHEFLHRGELNALCWPHRCRGRPDPPRSGVGHQLLLRPSRHFDAPTQFGDIGFRKTHLERTDRCVVGHGLLLWCLRRRGWRRGRRRRWRRQQGRDGGGCRELETLAPGDIPAHCREWLIVRRTGHQWTPRNEDLTLMKVMVTDPSVLSEGYPWMRSLFV